MNADFQRDKSSQLLNRIWQLAWPVMISNITVPLLGLVDTAVLGHLDQSHHLGAVALGNQILVLMLWSFGFLRMGTTSLTAYAKGAQSSEFEVFRHALILALMIAFPLMLVGQLAAPFIIAWMGPGPMISPGAEEYISIRLMAAPAVLVQYAIIGWFIGIGNSKVPLVLLVLANSLNAVLDVILVYQFNMTSDGVAWASLVADYCSAAAGFWWLLSYQKQGQLKLSWPGWQSLSPLIKINQDLFVRTLCLLSVFAFFTAQGAQQGEDVLALNAIMLTLLLFISNALDGFAHAAESLIGQSLGAGQQQELKRVIWLTGLCSVLVAVLLTFILWGFADNIIYGLTDIAPVRALANEYLVWLICLPLVGFSSYWLDGVFIGSQGTRAMKYSMLASALLIFLPVWFLTQAFTNHGLWFSFYAFLLARSVFLIPSFLTILNKHQIFAEKN